MERLDITAEEYHAYDAISSGGVRCIRNEGAPEYHAQYVTGTKKFAGSNATRMGSCTHFAVEGVFEDKVTIVPSVVLDDAHADDVNDWLDSVGSGSKRVIVGDDINNKLPSHRQYMDILKDEAERDGKIWATEDEARIFAAQMSAVLADPKCRWVLEQGGNREQAAIEGHSSGLTMKALADIDAERIKAIYDIKTTRFSSRIQFARDAIKRGYHIQLRHYELVFDTAPPGGIIAVKNEEPIFALYYEFDSEMRDLAATAHDYAMADLASRMQSGKDDPSNWLPEGYGTTSHIGVNGIDQVKEVEWQT